MAEPFATQFRDTDPEHIAKVQELYARLNIQEQYADHPHALEFVDVACLERYLRYVG
jgi:hypothetical protein